jgi:hypothetical protein
MYGFTLLEVCSLIAIDKFLTISQFQRVTSEYPVILLLDICLYPLFFLGVLE